MVNVHNIVNKFLIDPKYQVYRHIILVILLFLILLPIYMTDYGEEITIFEYIFIGIVDTLFYYILICFSLKTIIPKILQRINIKRYILYLLGITILMTIFQIGFSYIIEEQFDIAHDTYNSEFEYLLYIIVVYFLNCFCLMGFFVIVLLRTWIVDRQYINQLEREHLSSELQELKNKIRPDFLLNMLNKANVLAKSNPEKASEILLKLSRILRYQLYDSKRERVILSSEVIFMKDYLYLEKIRSDNFQFEITETGNVKGIFVPSLLFIPIIETATKYVTCYGSGSSINIEIEVDNNMVDFTCSVSKLNGMNPFSTKRGIVFKQIESTYRDNSSILISDSELYYITHRDYPKLCVNGQLQGLTFII